MDIVIRSPSFSVYLKLDGLVEVEQLLRLLFDVGVPGASGDIEAASVRAVGDLDIEDFRQGLAPGSAWVLREEQAALVVPLSPLRLCVKLFGYDLGPLGGGSFFWATALLCGVERTEIFFWWHRGTTARRAFAQSRSPA